MSCEFFCQQILLNCLSLISLLIEHLIVELLSTVQ
jgi:hypothetical protein